MRKLKLYHGHEYVATLTPNTAGVRSRVMVVTPPNGVFLVLARLFAPVVKLLADGGAQIAPSTKVYIGKQRPGDSSPTFLPGVFTLQSFYDLTTAQQRNAENRSTLVQDLGAGIALREQESLVIEVESPDVIDWTEAGTAFEFVLDWSPA